MMDYEARLRLIRDRICMRNARVMSPGRYPSEITISVEPTSEMVQIGSNWEIELYTIRDDGVAEAGWFVEVFEKSTEREFTIFIYNK